jgi:hypothetical protein
VITKFSRNIARAAACVLVASLGAASAAPAVDDYGPFDFDGGKVSCNSDTGPEIKKTQHYAAPADRFFVENSISVSEISGWGKAHSCELQNVQKKQINVQSDVGTISVNVITAFDVFAHADCGSGWLNNSGGKTASVECNVAAKMQKYTNQ